MTDLEKLYPKIDPSYFKDKGNVFKQQNDNDNKHKWVPFIRSVDLNNTKENPYENKPKTAYEIGVRTTF